jgi:hypothetical protein
MLSTEAAVKMKIGKLVQSRITEGKEMSGEKALIVRVRNALVSHCQRRDRFMSHIRENLVEQWRSFRKRVETLYTWMIDRDLLRYSRFRINHRRNERAIQHLEKDLTAKRFELYTERKAEDKNIAKRYSENSERFLERQRQVEENQERNEKERVSLEWSWFDRTTLSEIESKREMEFDRNRDAYETKVNYLVETLRKTQRDAAQYRTAFWSREAAYYIVPLPKEDEDMWDGENLTTKGEHTLRTLVRRERREQWETAQIRIALILSVLTFGISVFNAINNLHLHGR